jgi:hypothetical protein
MKPRDDRKLRVPAVLAFAVIGASAAAALVACGDDSAKKPDAATSCLTYCVYQGSDTGACPFPTCATGSNHDMCPAGCLPEPVT